MENPYALKLADQIRTVVAESLSLKVRDPRLGFVTITDCRVTGDMREATLFYTVLGDEKARTSTAAALKSATGMLRTLVGQRLGLKFAPTLAFVHDALQEEAAAVEEVLREAKAKSAELSELASHAQYAGEADPYKKPHVDDEEADASPKRDGEL